MSGNLTSADISNLKLPDLFRLVEEVKATRTPRILNRKEARTKFQTFRRNVPVLPFSLSVAKRCAILREQLKYQQKRVKSRALDLMNAAIALEHGLTLVTHNVEDYRDIPGLRVYPLAA